MNKLMPLEVLSSIKGAKESDSLKTLFKVLTSYAQDNENKSILEKHNTHKVFLNELRDDTVVESSEKEKVLIKKNFPIEKNGYLVVSKAIED